MAETAEARLKRLKMRSWRRGTKEMDLVLGHWADAHLAGLTEPDLTAFESLLAENDQDLMSWMLGQSSPPAELAPMLDRVTGFARGRISQR
ncbi:MAG TPA: succinate dehydrogenase assembly factor 2 [Tabrizicola sp.]|nr:succinate dehydrogenase assembly factor 2 [Tabrizicola sp.]